MIADVDAMTAADRPRKRGLMIAAAVLVPLIVLVAGAAWFVRSYVLPPSIAITPLPAHAAVAHTPEHVITPSPEMTGASISPASPAEPEVRYTSNSAEVWAAVPLPGPPRTVQRAEPEAAALPAASLVPVPMPRPRPARTTN